MIKSYNPESLLMIVVYDCDTLIVQAPCIHKPTYVAITSIPVPVVTGLEPSTL
jgi:hypothetical protein